MFLKKSPFIQNINPRLVFTIIFWLIVTWVLSKPLQGIGKNTYNLLGGLVNNLFQGISDTKSSAEDLLRSKTLLVEQNKKISLLEIKINTLQEKAQKSNRLETLLGLKKDMNYNTLSASVIGRTVDNWHKQIILDKGKINGIKIGDTVLSSHGIVGQIVDVSNNSSITQLISDPSFRLGCKIKRNNVLGILAGKTNSIGLLHFIPVGSDVMLGDLIVTSGIVTGMMPPIYPLNHFIGKIKKVSKKRTEASDLYIEVKLSENLNTLSEVLIFSPN